MNKEIKDKFSRLACQLSPENLWCDGEASPTYVKRKYKELMKEWEKLEKEVGRKVSEEETWNF